MSESPRKSTGALRAINAPIEFIDEAVKSLEAILGTLSSVERSPVRRVLGVMFWDVFHAGVSRAESMPCRHCGQTQLEAPPRVDPTKGG